MHLLSACCVPCGWCYILYRHDLICPHTWGTQGRILALQREEAEAQREVIAEGHVAGQWQSWAGNLGLSDRRTNTTGVTGRGPPLLSGFISCCAPSPPQTASK